MFTAKELIEVIENLIASERYANALNKLEDEGIGLLESLPLSLSHRKLLLYAARIYFRNHRIRDATSCLNKLESNYPDIADNFDFTYLKSEILLLFEGDTGEARGFIEASIRRSWSEEERHWLKFNLGMVHFIKGDYLTSDQLFQSCHEYLKSKENEHFSGYVSYMMGYTAFQRCFFSIAGTYYKRALSSFAKIGKNVELGNTLKMLGILAYRTGKYAEAERNLQRAIGCYGRCDNGIGIVDSKTALGRVYIFIGRYDRAEKLLLESHNKAIEYGYKRGMAVSAEFLGELYYHLERYQNSLRFLKLDEKLARQIAPRGDVAVEVYRRLGDVYLALDRLDEAEDVLAKALELSNDLHDKYELGSVLRAYGTLAARKNDIDLARSFFNEAIVNLKIIKESFELAQTYYISAKIYERLSESGDIPSEIKEELISEAKSHLLEAIHLFSSHDLEKRARECKGLLKRLEDKSHSNVKEPECTYIYFDSKWLYEGILVARSRQMLDVASRIKKIAPSSIPILITGETGTGKEVVARLLHKSSTRAKGPFVAVNCAAVPQAVFESEFFGHKKGSFTGAFQDSMGLIERASGGTLFLDEISELDSQQQAKLLRALQEEKIRSVGESRERPVDVRIVSASNVDVQCLLASGKLREDFFYRITGEEIHLEPLRNRRDDVPALFAYYMDRDGEGFSVEKGVLELLESYHWPGNVRELINLAKSLSLLKGRDRPVRIYDLPVLIRKFTRFAAWPHNSAGAVNSNRRELLKNHASDLEEIRQLIYSSLERCGGNRSAAARELGIARSTLYRRMEELGIG